MQISEHTYVYESASTGSCYAQTAETADPNALASRFRGYVHMVRYVARCGDAPSESADLGSRMAEDRAFQQRVEAGWTDLENGRFSTVDEVKRRLGDL